MTTNMQEIINQAFEAGRSVGKLEMAERTRLEAAFNLGSPPWTAEHKSVNNIAAPHKRIASMPPKTLHSPKEPKAPIVARGVKKATTARAKGVKAAVVTLITSGPATIAQIVERTGHKENSIISTLAGLKKAGLAMQDGKAWIAITHDSSGNSEAVQYPGNS